MSLGKSDGDKIVNMGWKASEARFIAHEAVDEDEQQAPAPAILQGRVRDQ